MLTVQPSRDLQLGVVVSFVMYNRQDTVKVYIMCFCAKKEVMSFSLCPFFVRNYSKDLIKFILMVPTLNFL
jgi:hypothetical protein